MQPQPANPIAVALVLALPLALTPSLSLIRYICSGPSRTCSSTARRPITTASASRSCQCTETKLLNWRYTVFNSVGQAGIAINVESCSFYDTLLVEAHAAWRVNVARRGHPPVELLRRAHLRRAHPRRWLPHCADRTRWQRRARVRWRGRAQRARHRARHQALLHRGLVLVRLLAPRRAASLAPRRAAPLLLQGGRLLRLILARRQASTRPRLQQPLTVTILLLWLHLLWLHYGWTDAPGAAPVELDPDAPASRALARAGALLGATEAVGGGPAAAVAAGAGGGTRGCCGSASGGGSCGGFVRSLIPRPSPTHLCAPHTH